MPGGIENAKLFIEDIVEFITSGFSGLKDNLKGLIPGIIKPLLKKKIKN
jgi:hypothetical protein